MNMKKQILTKIFRLIRLLVILLLFTCKLNAIEGIRTQSVKEVLRQSGVESGICSLPESPTPELAAVIAAESRLVFSGKCSFPVLPSRTVCASTARAGSSLAWKAGRS